MGPQSFPYHFFYKTFGGGPYLTSLVMSGGDIILVTGAGPICDEFLFD